MKKCAKPKCENNAEKNSNYCKEHQPKGNTSTTGP
jgi:hypothetical protein